MAIRISEGLVQSLDERDRNFYGLKCQDEERAVTEIHSTCSHFVLTTHFVLTIQFVFTILSSLFILSLLFKCGNSGEET